jgi:hypothetical protein
MSVLVRFKTGSENIKARIYEQSSTRKTCTICKEESRGMIVLLVRHLQPKKPDSAVCHKCIVKLCLAPVIETVVEPPVKKPVVKRKTRGRPKKRGVKRGTVLKKEKCPHCERKMPKNCIGQHMKFKHPEEYAKLIDNKIEESTDASVEETKAASDDQ